MPVADPTHVLSNPFSGLPLMMIVWRSANAIVTDDEHNANININEIIFLNLSLSIFTSSCFIYKKAAARLFILTFLLLTFPASQSIGLVRKTMP